MKLLSIVGTRPQIIKSLYMNKICEENCIEHYIIDTFQHYDHGLNDIFVEENKAKVMYPFSALAELKLMEPDFVLVYGDTNSTVKAIQAARSIAKIVHIEAGLRCGNLSLPEEVNRIYADKNSDFQMCPTPSSIKNLNGYPGAFYTGDILRDIFMSTITSDLDMGDYFLATIHRAYNSDTNSFIKILKILNGLKYQVVFPVHPKFKDIDFKQFSNIKVISPVNHSDMKALIVRSKAVVTDSGGLCREAYFGCVPCSVIRSEIEFPECIDTKGMQLIDKNDENAVEKINYFKTTRVNFTPTIFGCGNSAMNILNFLGDNV